MGNIFLFIAAAVLLASLGGKPEVRSLVIEASGDTYLVADLTPPKKIDAVGGSALAPPNPVMDQNFGRVAFFRVWYDALDTENQQLLSMGLLKFDLEPVKDLHVESVSLQAYGLRADLSQPARLVDVALVQSEWVESKVTYNSRPTWGTAASATNAVFGANNWYTWDVTTEVVAAAGSLPSVRSPIVSFVLVLRNSQEGQEEQVLFVSREAGQNAPRLIVTYNYEFQIPWWTWATGVGVAAVIAFVFGIWVSRRMRPHASAPMEITA